MGATRVNPPMKYRDVSVTNFNVGAGVTYYQGSTPATPAGYVRLGAFVKEFQRPGSSIIAVTAMDDTSWFATAYSVSAQGQLRFEVRFVYAVAEAAT